MDKLNYSFTWLTEGGNNMFGQLQLAKFKGLGEMEQDIASAASALETADSGMTGAPHYEPRYFCGRRPVRGVNYSFIAVKTQAVNPSVPKLVRVEINFFNGQYELVPSMEIDLS